ncbi:tetratricopeptide repeat protein [Flammeovirga aprica]|uniref:Tetratricopeptide repeat protein n=1 Tax=Flammeovirga aprica JL-4 TaxID=694437 RepID=A0A7X9RVE7_9BACT|nr:hypothetical protein [Flammeovirga aprica]NME69452.1 hypothetical protein [Flammeovirga aprica JL-4]
MNTILTLLIVLNIFSDHNGIGRIAEENKHKSVASEAFQAKDYKSAIEAYSYLVDSMNVQDEAAMLGLAHSYFLSEDMENALQRYVRLQNAEDKKIASTANQQLGILKSQEQKIDEALEFMKQAIKLDPENVAARYNYELLLKQKKEQEEQEQQNQDQNQDNQDQNQDNKENQDKDQKDKNEDNKDQEGDDSEENKDQNEEGDKQDNKDQKDSKQGKDGEQEENNEQEGEQGEETEEERKEREKAEEKANFDNRMEEIKMPASQAQMILDALKNKEVQYFQQQKKKSKKQDRNKPDW